MTDEELQAIEDRIREGADTMLDAVAVMAAIENLAEPPKTNFVEFADFVQKQIRLHQAVARMLPPPPPPN